MSSGLVFTSMGEKVFIWQYSDCSFPLNSSPLPVPGVKDGLDGGGDLGEEGELGDEGEQVDDKFAENETRWLNRI